MSAPGQAASAAELEASCLRCHGTHLKDSSGADMIRLMTRGECSSVFVKVRDLIRLLEADGWYLSRTRGSHRQYKHARKPSVVTVPGAMNDDLPPGLLKHILKHAVLKLHRGGRSE